MWSNASTRTSQNVLLKCRQYLPHSRAANLSQQRVKRVQTRLLSPYTLSGHPRPLSGWHPEIYHISPYGEASQKKKGESESPRTLNSPTHTPPEPLSLTSQKNCRLLRECPDDIGKRLHVRQLERPNKGRVATPLSEQYIYVSQLMFSISDVHAPSKTTLHTLEDTTVHRFPLFVCPSFSHLFLVHHAKTDDGLRGIPCLACLVQCYLHKTGPLPARLKSK